MVDALCARFGYQALLPDGTANPQTKALFARDIVKDWITNEVRQHERGTAVALAAKQSDTNAVIL